MNAPSPIREITEKQVAARFQAGELAQFARLGISVSDTETTGLRRGVNGLTELASIRATLDPNGKPKLMAFHHHLLPLKPAYRDYLVACEKAKAEGKPLPPYDRAKYEYAVDPHALSVTGTELVRERLDGPITGLRVRGTDDKWYPVKNAVPFYEAADVFKEFTQNGEQDVYFNAPFDLPFLAEQLRDIEVDRMLRAEVYRQEHTHADDRLTPRERDALNDYTKPYEQLREHEKDALRTMLAKLVDLPIGYTNSARFHCLMYGNLAANGFKARNNLDTVYAPLMSAAEKERGDHSALEDVVMAARVALDQAKHTDGKIHSIAELFGDLLHRVDAMGMVTDGPSRAHRKHKDEAVQGDVLLKFSDDPKKLGSDAESFWQFLVAFRELRHWSPGSPEHVLDIDDATHRVTINAERKNPLSLSFLKKCAYFHQLLKAKNEAEVDGKHTVIQSIQPFDSTGAVMDVVLRKPDGVTVIVEAVPFNSLRANTAFLEAHPDQAEDFLKLIRHLMQCDQSVGSVLLKDLSDGSTRITVKGHLRGFGECVLSLAPRADIGENIAALTSELETQLRLGAIPGVAGFEIPIINDEIEEDDTDIEKKPGREKNAVATEKHPDGHVSLALSANVFAAVAMRLNQKKQKNIPLGQDSRITTDHGDIAITYDTSVKDYPRYRLSGQMDALHDFVDLDHEPESARAKEGRKPAALIRDASWLLYRLEQLPGTYHVRVNGHMAVLEQNDGVDAETLNMLYHLKIPFKAYDREIKLDLAQLMENAFHWSVELKRCSTERKVDAANPVAEQKLKPPQLIEDLKDALYSGNAKAIEMSEQQQFWLLDHSKAMHGQPQHHPIVKNVDGVKLLFNDKKQLVIERSDVQRRDVANNADGRSEARITHTTDGKNVTLHAPELLVMLVAHQMSNTVEGANPKQLTLPIAHEAQMRQALDTALRYTYWLSKATGSERQTLQKMTLAGAIPQVNIKLPDFPLLATPASPLHTNPDIAAQLQKIHVALSDASTQTSEPRLRNLLKTLREGLPDVRFASARHADLHELVATVRPQLVTLQQMHTKLDTLLGKEGAMGEVTASSAITLGKALDTLGLLLHEIASMRNAKVVSGQSTDDVFNAIADAQEKLSNVAYGLVHLREDMATLNGRIIGTRGGNSVSLLREQGKSIANTLVDEARAALRYDPNVNLGQHLQPYVAQMCELMGVEQGGKAMHEIMHALSEQYLASLATSKDPRARQTIIADYLLQHDRPEWNATQRLLFIQQHQPKRTKNDAQIAYVAAHRPYAMSQQEWRAMLTNPQYNSRSKGNSNRHGFLGTEKEDERYALFSERAVPRPEPTTTGAPPPDYARYQQCRRLLNAIHKTREEAIDLDHAVPHALRALRNLISKLSQNQTPLPLETTKNELSAREVVESINARASTVGDIDDPFACIRKQIAQQRASIQTNFLGLLARNKITPVSTDDGVTLTSADFTKLFGVWQRLEKSGKLTKSEEAVPHEQRDTIRELHPLTLSYVEIGKVTLNVDSGHIKLKVRRPDSAEKWLEICKGIAEYARLHHLQLPELPVYDEMPATYDMYLRPSGKTLERPTAKVMADSVQREPAARTRHAHLRNAIRAVDLPTTDDWPKTAGR